MNYQNVLAFMAVVEHGNITSAAKALHYTPPGIAEALKQLEKGLGVQLVVRKRGVRNVVITAAGRDFIPKAKKWVRLNQEIEQFVKDRKKKRQRIHYEPSIDHIQCDEVRAMHEILPEHFVYCNTPELERYRLML